MYAYHHYFEAEKVALLYPGEENYISGNFVEVNHHAINEKQECGLLFVESNTQVKEWREKIVKQVERWVGKSEYAFYDKL